jgi:hypothetical protein
MVEAPAGRRALFNVPRGVDVGFIKATAGGSEIERSCGGCRGGLLVIVGLMLFGLVDSIGVAIESLKGSGDDGPEDKSGVSGESLLGISLEDIVRRYSLSYVSGHGVKE